MFRKLSLFTVWQAPKGLHSDKSFKQMPWKQRFFELPRALSQKFQFSSAAPSLECHFAVPSALIPVPSTMSHSVFTDLKWGWAGARPGNDTPSESFLGAGIQALM